MEETRLTLTLWLSRDSLPPCMPPRSSIIRVARLAMGPAHIERRAEPRFEPEVRCPRGCGLASGALSHSQIHPLPVCCCCCGCCCCCCCGCDWRVGSADPLPTMQKKYYYWINIKILYYTDIDRDGHEISRFGGLPRELYFPKGLYFPEVLGTTDTWYFIRPGRYLLY